MFNGVAVWRSCRLLYLGDFALLKEIKDYPSMVRCGVIVLVVVVTPEMLPANGTKVFQEVIWHHYEKLPRRVPNHQQPGIVGIRDRHRRWHAANGPLSGSATSVSTPCGDGDGCPSTRAFLCVYRHSDHDGFPANPHSIRIPLPRLQGPRTYGAILYDHHQQSTILTRCGLTRSPFVDLSGTTDLVAACFLRMRWTVTRVRPTRPAIALCHMPSRKVQACNV